MKFITRQTTDKYLLVGFLNINSLPKSRKGEKNFDISHLMDKKNIDHIKLANTGRHWPSLPEYDTIPQIFCDHFMSQTIEVTTDYNLHNPL